MPSYPAARLQGAVALVTGASSGIGCVVNKAAWVTEDALNNLLQLIPYGRIGEPEDVARAVAWPASDEAGYVTGVTLYVDGGMVLYPSSRDNG